MKYLITGATGFVGRHLVREAVARGIPVRCFARPTSDRSVLADLPLEWTIGTFDDATALDRAVSGVDRIIHAAGLTRALAPGPYFRVNADSVRALLDAVRRTDSPVERFVYVSSLAAAGSGPPGGPPIDEDREPAPIDHYGRSKREGERIVLEADGPAVTVVRPPGVYGPGDRNFLPLYRTANRYGILPVVGGREKRFSLIHASDLARGILLAVESPAAVGRIYFLTGGTYTPEDLRHALEVALDRRLRLVYLPRVAALMAGIMGDLLWKISGRPRIVCSRKVRDLLQPNWACSGRRAAEELGFHPEIDLIEGMKETIADLRARGLL